MRVFEISIWNINYLGHREWHSSDIFHWADKSQLPLCTRDIWWVEFVELSETICFSLKELSKSGQMDNTSKWLFLSTAVKESGITPAESGIYNLKWGASQTKDSLFVFRGSRFALGLQWGSFRSQLGWLINANMHVQAMRNIIPVGKSQLNCLPSGFEEIKEVSFIVCWECYSMLTRWNKSLFNILSPLLFWDLKLFGWNVVSVYIYIYT